MLVDLQEDHSVMHDSTLSHHKFPCHQCLNFIFMDQSTFVSHDIEYINNSQVFQGFFMSLDPALPPGAIWGLAAHNLCFVTFSNKIAVNLLSVLFSVNFCYQCYRRIFIQN